MPEGSANTGLPPGTRIGAEKGDGSRQGAILVVGGGSFLARHFVAACEDPDGLRVVSHRDYHPGQLAGVDRVVNFALHPDFRVGPYDPGHDLDRALAIDIGDRPIHLVMLSSRKVYAGGGGRPLRENDPLAADGSGYGPNKVQTERFLQDHLGDRVTILRLSNIFGLESGRTTFMGIAQKSLAGTGRITLDVSPFTRRDFLPVDHFARLLWQVMGMCPSGPFNLGSGLALPVGQVVLWLLEGFGGGELVVSNYLERDSFSFDIKRLSALTGCVCRETEIRHYCLQLGRTLRHGIS